MFSRLVFLLGRTSRHCSFNQFVSQFRVLLMIGRVMCVPCIHIANKESTINSRPSVEAAALIAQIREFSTRTRIESN